MHLALPVIFRILYGCGLRVSEVVGLRYKDVNLEDGILTIRKAKTDRDRYIPLSDSVKEACISYADKIWWEKDSDFFFPAPDKTMLSPMTVYQRYRRYLEVAGISHGGKGQGPRLHDIRHPYVKHTTKIFSLRLMDFQAQAYPDARRKTRGACQLHRGGQSQSPVRPLCNRKQFS